MNREQLCHTLRAAADVTGVTDLVVIGSQAVLGTYEHWRLPGEATRSLESDLAVDIVIARVDADESELADRIDGAIGEGSMFHRTHGYYAQGVEVATATLIDGWRDRLVPLVCERGDGTVGAVGWCLEVNDLWLSKACAGRPKDDEFCMALAAEGLVDLETVEERIAQVDGPGAAVARRVLAHARQLDGMR